MTPLDTILGRGRRTLRDEVATMIERLGSPLTDEEVRSGWSSDKKRTWLDRFNKLDRQLASGQAPERHTSLARAMDFDGIGNGNLSDLAARISNRLSDGETYSSDAG